MAAPGWAAAPAVEVRERLLPRDDSWTLYATPSRRPEPAEPATRIVVIVGATGTGKTKLSINAAVTLGGEVVNADKIQLYAGLDVTTNKMFYLVRQDQSNETWRVLKIDRSKPTELNILKEDPHAYTAAECVNLLRKIQEENKDRFKLVTNCYGIIGFVKFNGPYYMLLITGRSKIGTILGHAVYSVDKSKIIKIPHGPPKVANPLDEKRQFECFSSMDMSDGFFFSYTYNLSQTLQHDIIEKNEPQSLKDTTFVWNEFLTERFESPNWTVSLVHGFFIQKKVPLKVSGSLKDFQLIIIARHSRHVAGQRYLKRGVNEKGMVANDVEIEQIVIEETEDGVLPQITSFMQRRGSIPLFWSQEIVKCPILAKIDESYSATCLHFEYLKTTYRDPIIVLNLVKCLEEEPCESPLLFNFEQAIQDINNKLPPHGKILYAHIDVKRYSRSQEVLPLLVSIGSKALERTKILHLKLREQCNVTSLTGSVHVKDPPLSVQNGVLRTNCLDCLDRTNGAQFAVGLSYLNDQLRVMGIIKSEIALNHPLSHILMDLYEKMGDALSMHYASSPALNQMFWKQRGECVLLRRVKGYFRSAQRLYNNYFMDGNKQKTLDLFLGYSHPHNRKASMMGSAKICENKETQDNEERERSSKKSSCGSIVPVVMELEETMHKSLNMNQVHPVRQSDESSSSGNPSRTQSLLVAEMQNGSSQPGHQELFHSNFLSLDEGSNAVKFLEESVSEG